MGRDKKYRAWEPEYSGEMHYSDQKHAEPHDEDGRVRWVITQEGIHIEVWEYDNWADPDGNRMHLVKPEGQVIMEYIGITDGRYNDLYEGDIVEFRANYVSIDRSGDQVGEIYWDNYYLAFMLRVEGIEEPYIINDETDEFYCYSKRIGNIYENPELIDQSGEKNHLKPKLN